MSLKGNIKALSLALAAVFAFGAIIASAAQANAPVWTVEGGSPSATDFGSEAFTAESTGLITLIGGGLTLKSDAAVPAKGECKSTGTINARSAVGQPGTVTASTLTCTTVSVYSGTTKLPCTAHSPGQPDGTVKTNELDGRLVWMAATGDSKVGITFTPVSGTEFAKIEVTGAACPVSGNYPVAGNVIATGNELGKAGSAITTDVTEAPITFPSPGDVKYWTNQTPTRTEDTDPGLTLGGAAATFTGEFDVKLNSDKKVGVEPG